MDLLGPPHFRTGGQKDTGEFVDGNMGWLVGEISYYVQCKNGVVVRKDMFSNDPTVAWILGPWLRRNLL